MNLENPNAMNSVLSRVLRGGVILSAAVIGLGFVLFLIRNAAQPADSFIQYHAKVIPHGNFSVGLDSIGSGLLTLNPYSIIELGLLILLATPVSRVFLSIILFKLEGDRKYVYLTIAVFLILLFSMIVTPFIPSFGG